MRAFSEAQARGTIEDQLAEARQSWSSQFTFKEHYDELRASQPELEDEKIFAVIRDRRRIEVGSLIAAKEAARLRAYQLDATNEFLIEKKTALTAGSLALAYQPTAEMGVRYALNERVRLQAKKFIQFPQPIGPEPAAKS